MQEAATMSSTSVTVVVVALSLNTAFAPCVQATAVPFSSTQFSSVVFQSPLSAPVHVSAPATGLIAAVHISAYMHVAKNTNPIRLSIPPISFLVEEK